MLDDNLRRLEGKKGLMIGIANEHSIAFPPKEDLLGRLVDCSRAGFLQALDVSCHSFIRMARLAEPAARCSP